MTTKTHTRTRKNVPWKHWKQQKPSTHQKTLMLKRCGKKCFLGSKKIISHLQKKHMHY